MDQRPRSWTPDEIRILRDLAAGVMAEIELRRDLLEKRRAEALLAASEAKYRLLFERSPNPMWVVDSDTLRFLAVNEAAIVHYGYSRDKFLAMSVAEVSLPEDRVTPRPILKDLPTQYHVSGRARHRVADGRIIDVDLASHEIPYEGRRARLVTISDVTIQREAEAMLARANQRLEEEVRARTAELARSERRFRALIENATEIITILAVDGTIRYKSPAAKELGWTPEELIGRSIFDLIHPSDVELARTTLEHLVEEALPQTFQLRVRHKDGSYRFLHCAAMSLLGEHAVAGIVINSRDVTELRQGEERLRQAQKMEAVGRLAGGIAHDFNNIITAIKGNASLLLDEVGDAGRLTEDLREIDQAADRATALTRQLLAFSRQQVLKPMVLDLNAVIVDAERFLRRTVGADVEFVTILDPGLGRVLADPGQIEQVLMNLAVNARDAMPTGGKLITTTSNVDLDPADLEVMTGARPDHAGSYVVLTVTDTGIGMSEEVRARIFEPFYTTKPLGKGTGLGLATVFGIIEQTGGHLTVESAEGRGTTFRIYLPRTDAAVPTRTREKVHTTLPSESGTILLVEDEPSVRRVAARVLDQAGFRVLVAANGEEAIRIVERRGGSIDVLLTDVVMPLMGGPELSERLRKRFPQLPVVFTSGYAGGDFAGGRSLPTDVMVLEKPYTPEALLGTVVEALQSRRT